MYEFTEFYREGLHLGTNMFGTTFFVLTGLHGAHVTIGIIWLLSLWGRSMQGTLAAGEVRGGRDRRPLLALRRRRVDLHLHRDLPDPARTEDEAHDRQAPTSSSRAPRSSAADGERRARSGRRSTHPVAAEEHATTPAPRQYVLIAVVLVIVTGVEIATSYIEARSHRTCIIVALGIMAAVKFFLVARLVHAHEAGPAVLPALLRRRHRRSPRSCTASCCSSSRARS